MRTNAEGRLAPCSNEFHVGELDTAVATSLGILRPLSAVLDVYGTEETAGALRRAIAVLEEAAPAQAVTTDSLNFVVTARFSVQRKRVADLLLLGYGGSDWIQSTACAAPTEFLFRSEHCKIVPEVDYPLNAGGSLKIVLHERGAECSCLDLESIGRGLDTLATKYPRHFADFLMCSEDSVTGSVFLQCCLFGEILYE